MGKSASNSYITKSDLPTSLPVSGVTWQTGLTSSYTINEVFSGKSPGPVKSGSSQVYIDADTFCTWVYHSSTKTIHLPSPEGKSFCLIMCQGGSNSIYATSSTPVYTIAGATYTSTFTASSGNCIIVAIKQNTGTSASWRIAAFEHR